MQEITSEKLAEQIAQTSVKFAALKVEINKIIVGHASIIDLTLIAMLSKGHVLLEGVPGVAKTTLIKTIAEALGLSFSRIQFTPDLLPTDLIGTLIYNPKLQDFDTKKGPLFANLVLADEINRSPAKVQSALLEAMQERQVTIGSTTYPLEEPFLVFATQNPIENEGTYQMPEAQIDRFMFKIFVGYPTFEQEREILHRSCKHMKIEKIVSRQDILQAQNLVQNIYIDQRLLDYILNIVFATRQLEKYGLSSIAKFVAFGASPRASIAMSHACKAYALLQNRHFVVPDDIKFVAKAILRHRILLTYHAQAENITTDIIIDKIFDVIPTP